MKLFKGLFFASFVAITIATLVSFFPHEEGGRLGGALQEEGRIEPVFKINKPIVLDKDNLVSFLKHLTLHFSFKQVELENDTLFIQMNVADKAEEEQGDVQELIYQDVFQLLDNLYRYTTNIEQVYIRFLQNPKQRHHVDQRELRIQATPKTLLLSVESKRIHYNKKQTVNQGQFPEDQEELEAFILATTKVIYGTGWGKKQ